ncbi:uncharacterized protein K444DRAFT_632624 [Hyaloscypha bicolor E]|uniref:MFS general substrate transporter n=1 Tax=Hyaloscypha bicolor E TaxID=1095630 RepID=A0A2J6SZL3_9HELO|nr:uncharacterized protein K444DRAFT_632624 [Hyaloscypha bicolor E]PMD56199.1 hypothetical protein K444DRAFT_632624 [Hyaloscypha bicolor E]
MDTYRDADVSSPGEGSPLIQTQQRENHTHNPDLEKPTYKYALYAIALGVLLARRFGNYQSIVTSRLRALISLPAKASDLGELRNAAWIPLAGSISDATYLVPLANLPLWRSVLVIVQSFGFMSGGPLGSLLASATSWHIPFLVESTLAGAATLILLLALRSPAILDRADSQPPEPSTTLAAPVHTFDILGGILLLFTVLVPLVGLNLWGNVLPGAHPIEITLLCLTLVLLTFFTYHERYNSKSTLLPLHMLKNPQSLAVLACTGLTIFARNQLDIHITFYAEVRSNPDNTFTNWILTCQFLGVSLGSVFSGWLIAKSRQYKWLLVVSIASAFTLYLLISTGIIRLFASTAMEDRSMSYAFFELTVSVFADIGIAVSSALQRQWFIAGMQRAFGHSPGTDKLIAKSLQSLENVRKLPPEIGSRVLNCFVIALRKVFGVSCGLLALAVLVAALKNTPFGTRLPHINHLREAEDGDE